MILYIIFLKGVVVNRRSVLRGGLASLLAFASAGVIPATGAFAQNGDTSRETQVDTAMRLLSAQGQSQYLLVDKRNATMHIVRDGRITASSPVVLGSSRSDIFLSRTGSTGAGVFRMVPMDTRNTNNSTIAFREDPRLPYGQYTIHRVIRSPERLNALQTATPNDNFHSNGCINVPDQFYNLIWSSFADAQGRFRSGFDIVILPEDLSRTEEFIARRGGISDGGARRPSAPRTRRPNDDLLPVSGP